MPCSGSTGKGAATLWNSPFDVAADRDGRCCRIERIVAAVIVTCQVGCISHNACPCVKAHFKCCVFVESAGGARFVRVVEEVRRDELGPGGRR